MPLASYICMSCLLISFPFDTLCMYGCAFVKSVALKMVAASLPVKPTQVYSKDLAHQPDKSLRYLDIRETHHRELMCEHCHLQCSGLYRL